MGFVTLGVVKEAFERAPECLKRASNALNAQEGVDAETVAAVKRDFGTLPLDTAFDVFLSHATATADKALGVWQLLSEPPYGFSVYMDWIHDPSMDRRSVGKETASILRKRMQESQCLIYVVTHSSQTSVWMPWELGYFDAYKANVGILPVVEDENTAFAGHEYLSLYQPVTLESAVAMARTEEMPPTAPPIPDILAQMRKFAEAAAVSPDAFVRQMKAQPQLAGEWLRPHAEATMRRVPEMTALDPGQATEEARSIASIYAEEWLKMFGLWSKRR